MFNHLQDGHVAETDVLFLEWRHCIVANSVQDEFLACLFEAQVVLVVLLFNFVLRHELLACCGCITCCKGVGRVCAWIDWYRVGPGWVSDDEPVLTFGDCTCQMAVLLSLFVVMGFYRVEYTAKLVLSLSTASGVITLFKHVSLLRRDISVSYTLLDAEEVIVCVFGDDEKIKQLLNLRAISVVNVKVVLYL